MNRRHNRHLRADALPGSARTRPPIMKRILAFMLTAMAAVAAQPEHGTGAGLPSGGRPNILFIIADDQSPFDLKIYNPKSPLETPTIDRLAAEGMVFDGAYHMGSFAGAVCTPSRHMIMSGRTVWHLPIAPAARESMCPPASARPARCRRCSTAPATTRCAPARRATATRRPTSSSPSATTPRKRGGTDETGSAWHAEQVLDYLAERDATEDTRSLPASTSASRIRTTRATASRNCSRSTARSTTRTELPAARQSPSSLRCRPTTCREHPFPHGHPGPARRGGGQRRLDESRRAHDPQRTRPRVRLQREHRHPDRPRAEKARGDGRARQHLHLLHRRPRHRDRPPWSAGQAEPLRAHVARAVHREGPRHQAGLARAGQHLPARRAAPRSATSRASGAREANEGISFKPVLEGQTADASATCSTASTAAAPSPACAACKKGDWKLIKYDVLDGTVRETQLFNLAENPDELLAAASAIRGGAR